MLAFTSALLAYSSLNPATPRVPTPAATATPLFSGSGLVSHATYSAGDDDTCSKPVEVPTRLEVAAEPRAMPKKTEGEAQEIDPLGLWTPPKPNKPKGPNVYTLNLGRAIDMLRNDYPKVFTEKPDFSIFRKDIELHDPSGKRLTGLSQYEKVFDMLRFLRRTTMQDAQVTYRLVVADERIRVRWTAKLWMRDPALGITTTPNGDRAVVHLDGVSNYDLDSEGKIRKHTIENIILRGADAEAAPMELQLAWPKMAGALSPELALPYPFLTPLNEAAKGWVPPKGLAWLVGPAPTHEQSSSSGGGGASPAPKRSRGGEPQMSAGESPMERAARERAEDAEKARALAELRKPKEDGMRQMKNMFGVSLPQQCETSYDCERPDVCCDLLFGSFCCSGGLMIPEVTREKALQRQAIPIPVEVDKDLPFPGGGNLPPRTPGGLDF